MTIHPGSRALSKPLLICGVDRKLAGMAMILAVIIGANDGWMPKLSALALFIGLCGVGRIMTRKDPNAFAVIGSGLRRLGWRWWRDEFYDPMKRAI